MDFRKDLWRLHSDERGVIGAVIYIVVLMFVAMMVIPTLNGVFYPLVAEAIGASGAATSQQSSILTLLSAIQFIVLLALGWKLWQSINGGGNQNYAQ